MELEAALAMEETEDAEKCNECRDSGGHRGAVGKDPGERKEKKAMQEELPQTMRSGEKGII